MSQLVQQGRLRQEGKLNPHMSQSIAILQMNSEELLEYLNKIRQENPLIEHDDIPNLQKEYMLLRQRASWIDAGPSPISSAAAFDRGAPDKETESLSAFLRDQLARKRLPQRLLAMCGYLADLLDDNGWLSQDDLDELEALNVPRDMIDRALAQLQALEPAGVGARSLSECLILQMERLDAVPVGAKDIARHWLEALGKGHYRRIARETGLSLEQTHAAGQFLSTLAPYPGRAFLPEEPAAYVRPDVFIVEENGQLKVILNEYYLPHISVSDHYVRLLKEEKDEKTRAYLHEKLQQANWLINGLERRGGTLRACAEAVLETQYGFFSGQTDELAPMFMAVLAEKLSVHPSTISRALQGKYLQCRQGIYPLRYFFSRPLSETGLSQQAIRHKILLLIRDEPPGRPISDQKLCDILTSQGIQIARRTVAKYREQLGIPPSPIRKHKT